MTPPAAPIRPSRAGDRPNHARAWPASIATVPSMQMARAVKMMPSTTICPQTARPGSMNCGSSAVKKTIVLGFVTPTT